MITFLTFLGFLVACLLAAVAAGMAVLAFQLRRWWLLVGTVAVYLGMLAVIDKVAP